MQNARLDEAHAGIKIAGRNINNLRYAKKKRYADDTFHMAERDEKLKSFLMKMKVESEKAGLKLNTQKTKIMTSDIITSWQIDGETKIDFIFSGFKITMDSDCSYEKPKQHIKKQRHSFANKGQYSQSGIFQKSRIDVRVGP